MKLRSIALASMLALVGLAAQAADTALPRLTFTPDLDDFQFARLSDFTAKRLEQLSPKQDDSAAVAAERAAQYSRWKACAPAGCAAQLEHDYVLTRLQLAVSNVDRPGQPQTLAKQTAANVYMYLDSLKPVGLDLASPEGNAWALKTLQTVSTARLEAMDEQQNLRAGVRELNARALAESTMSSTAQADQVAAMGAKGGADFVKYLPSLPSFNIGANSR